MPAWAWIVLIVGVLVVIALVAWSVRRSTRTERLRNRFGPEYDRTLQEASGQREAEAELEARRRRREQLTIRQLDPTSRRRYAAAWTETQARFVDAPGEAVHEADALVIEVMRERGYPIENFEQRSADLSVDHGAVVQNYRAAHAISMANDSGQATTEDLRQAIVHYRALFEDLLEGEDGARMQQAR